MLQPLNGARNQLLDQLRRVSTSADSTLTEESSSASTLTTTDIPWIVAEVLQSVAHPADSKNQEDQGSSRSFDTLGMA